MPRFHIAVPLGGALDVSDESGADFCCPELYGKVVKIVHATRDEIVFEEVPATFACEGDKK